MTKFFGKKEWGRTLTAMVTPFSADGSVNRRELRRIASHLVDSQRNEGVVVSGTTGEAPTLDSDEKFAVLEETLSEVGDRAAVLFGAGTYDTKESIYMAREAERRGAHGIMLVNPYYSKPGQRGLCAHFKAIAESISAPVLIYNIQPRSSINLETPTLLELAEIGNIVAVKEASGNMSQISDVCAAAPEGFRVYSGDDALTLPILSVGGYGVVSVAAHIIGRDIREMIECFESDTRKAKAIHHRISPVVKALFSAPSPVPVKFALSEMGFDSERVRLPLVALSDSERKVVRSALLGFPLSVMASVV